MKIIYPTDINSVVPYYGDDRFFINVDGTPNRVEMSTSDSTNRGSIVHFVVNNVQLDQDGIADLMDSIADDVELLVESYFENDNQFTDEDLNIIDEIQHQVSNVKVNREILEVRPNDYKAISMIMDTGSNCPWDIYEYAVEDEFCGYLTMDLIHFVGEPEQFRDVAWQIIADRIEVCNGEVDCLLDILYTYVPEGERAGIDVLGILEKMVGDVTLSRTIGDPYDGEIVEMDFTLSEIYRGVHEDFEFY